MTTSMHVPGNPLQAVGIPVTLQKQVEQDKFGNPLTDQSGKRKMRCGMRLGGGIDMDPAHSPQGYPDKGVYVTYVEEGGPADMAGLHIHDKLLQVNGMDFTMITHEKACKYIRKDSTLHIIVDRKGASETYQQKPDLYGMSYENTNNNYTQMGGGYSHPERF